MSRWLCRTAAAVISAGGSLMAALYLASPAVATPLASTTAGIVTVQTVPALAGVRLSLDGISAVTGADGSALISDRQLDGAAQRLAVVDQQVNAGLRVSLDKVVNVPDHPLFHRLLLANLDEDRAVNIAVDTPQGSPVPGADVTSLTLQDSLGRTLQLAGRELSGPVWLASRRPVPDSTGVAGRNVIYTVASVIVHGTDIVSGGRLHFEPDQTTNWKIPGIFFTLTVQGDDPLGGKPAGSSVRLVYPDHSVVQVPLDSHHQARLTDLPRGNYKLQIRGGLVSLTTQLRLSRNQSVTQVVITDGDALVVGLAGLAVVGLLAGIGIVGRHLRQVRGRGRELSGVPA